MLGLPAHTPELGSDGNQEPEKGMAQEVVWKRKLLPKKKKNLD